MASIKTGTSSEYFRQENLARLLARHRAWMTSEKAAIKTQNS